MQTDSTSYTKEMGFLGVVKRLIENEGSSILLKGFGATLVGYFIQGSLKYGLYEVLKPIISSEIINKFGTENRLLEFVLSGFISETVGSCALSPFEGAKS